MPNFSGIWTVTQQMQAKGASTWPQPPGAPTIGTATAGTAACASVTFTAPGCTGYPAGVTGYRVISTPGCFTQTGASSPLVVTGLTVGTSYTFKAQATNASGYGALSCASNSITATVQTSQAYTTAGTYSWVAPSGVTSVATVVVGGGGGAAAYGGGGGGGLGYKNNYSVTPGNSYTVVVGAKGVRGGYGSTVTDGSQSYFVSTGVVAGYGGTKGSNSGGGTISAGGSYSGDGGGTGGGGRSYGGGGAAGYSGNGGDGGYGSSNPQAIGQAGSGGGGGGGSPASTGGAGGSGGGGVGLYGQGTSGGTSSIDSVGKGGSGGSNGGGGDGYFCCAIGYVSVGGSGGAYGGGGAPSQGSCRQYPGCGSAGAVRIVWCVAGVRGTPSFPSTNVGAP